MQRAHRLFFLMVAMAVSELVQAATVARYSFENDYQDSSGNDHHGAATGGLSFSSDTAASAEAGLASLNARTDFDFMTVGHDTAFELNELTIEALVRAPVTFTNSRPLGGINSQYVAHKLRSTGSGSFLSSYGFSVDQTNGLVRATLALSSGGIALLSTTAINDEEWHHIALTFNGTEARLYIDGAVEDQESSLTGSVLHGSAPFLVGAGNFATPAGTGTFRRNFQGDIDEVRVSDVALTSTQFIAVPEPSSSLMMCLGAFLLLKRRQV